MAWRGALCRDAVRGEYWAALDDAVWPGCAVVIGDEAVAIKRSGSRSVDKL